MTDGIGAHWQGFVDLESYIDHYMWCVGTSKADDGCGFMAWKNVGLKTRVSAKVKMIHGNSKMFLFMTTPPRFLSFSIPATLVFRPDFRPFYG
jgi:hypothetical protein